MLKPRGVKDVEVVRIDVRLVSSLEGVIAEHDGNIDNIRMTRKSPDFTEMLIDLEVYDLKHLTAIIAQIRAKRVVAKAERVNG